MVSSSHPYRGLQAIVTRDAAWSAMALLRPMACSYGPSKVLSITGDARIVTCYGGGAIATRAACSVVLNAAYCNHVQRGAGGMNDQYTSISTLAAAD